MPDALVPRSVADLDAYFEETGRAGATPFAVEGIETLFLPPMPG